MKIDKRYRRLLLSLVLVVSILFQPLTSYATGTGNVDVGNFGQSGGATSDDYWHSNATGYRGDSS